MIVQIVEKNAKGFVKMLSLSSEMYESVMKILLLMGISACSLRVLLELFRQYFDLRFSFFIFVETSVSVLFIWETIKNSHENVEKLSFICSELMLFISFRIRLKESKMFIPFYLFMFFVED